MNALIETLATKNVKEIVMAVAAEIAKHELKKHMSRDDLLALIGFKINDDDETEPTLDIEIKKGDLPPGISVTRAKAILLLCKKGVPDGEYIHVTSQKIMMPTTQQDTFHFNKTARIFGPQKQKEVIEWLAEQAGTVEAPVEPEVEPAIPSNWTPKHVAKLLERVKKCQEDMMINPFTSRQIVFNPAKMISHDEYNLCAPKKDKEKFKALVAYLDNEDDWQDIERQPAEPVKKTTKKGKAAKEEVKPRKAKATKEDVDSEEEVKPRKAKATKEEEVKPRKVKAAKEEAVKPRKAKAAKEDEDEKTIEDVKQDDGTASDEHDSEDRLAEAGIVDYDALRNVLANAEIKEDEYVNVYTYQVSPQTDELAKTHAFDPDFHIYVKREKSERATKALLGTIRKTLKEKENE